MVRRFQGMLCRLAVAVCASSVGACTSPVAINLDEPSANRVVVSLNEGGIVSSKELDPENEGKWLISVPREEVPEALTLLNREGLPSKERPGVMESAERSSLVPSMQTEQARLLAGMAGDLERSVAELDGVVSVRVHIAAATMDPFAEPGKSQTASASVLIRHNKNCTVLPEESVRRLVAGAVPNLKPDQVTVVWAPVAIERNRPRRLVTLGPFAVSPGSVKGLRWLVCGIATLNLILLSQVLLFWRKIRAYRAISTPASTLDTPS